MHLYPSLKWLPTTCKHTVRPCPVEVHSPSSLLSPGHRAELQLGADAVSPLRAVGRRPGARERHRAQDLRSAAQHQGHLLRGRQPGHRPPAGQCPAARPDHRLLRGLQQEPPG